MGYDLEGMIAIVFVKAATSRSWMFSGSTSRLWIDCVVASVCALYSHFQSHGERFDLLSVQMIGVCTWIDDRRVYVDHHDERVAICINCSVEASNPVEREP